MRADAARRLMAWMVLDQTGCYVTTSPIVTADWEAASGQQWVVPFGGGGGELRLRRLPVNVSAAYYNAVRSDVSPAVEPPQAGHLFAAMSLFAR